MARSTNSPNVEIGLLGNLAVRVDGTEVKVASPKQAAILTVLALEDGQAVSPGRLVEIVWGAEFDERAEHSLQQQVSSLRKLLEPGRRPRQEPLVVRTHRQGYSLDAAVDLASYESLAAVGIGQCASGDWAAALDSLDRALGTWRGSALADVRPSAWFDAAAARLEERRLAVREARAEALLATGRHLELVPELEELLELDPYREQLWGLLMVALFRSGRQADALAAFGRARRALVDQFGIEPGAELRDIERRVLEQDPTLLVPSGARADVGDLRATFRSDSGPGAGIVRLPDGQVVHLLAGANVIGRVPNAAVRLTDSRVSRTHAEIHVAEGRAVLRDLGSTNGTFVDGRALGTDGVDDHELVADTVFSVGGVELTYLA